MKPVALALDPGGSTGVAVRFDDESILTCYYSNYGQFEVYEMLQGLLIPRYTQVICERFFASGRIGAPGELTLQLIGAIIYAAWSKPCDLYLRTPQHRLAYINEAKAYLKKKGEQYVVHEIDALAHLFAWEHSHGSIALKAGS